MPTGQRITPGQRRARLARRQRLAGESRATDVGDLTGSLVALHATDPATIYLSAWARIDGFGTEDLDSAFYRDRSLIKHMAMRRTLFVFDRQTLADAQTGASDRVAATESRRLIGDVDKAALHEDPQRWLHRAKEATLEALADDREATSTELRADVPQLQGATVYGVGKSWGGEVPVGPRVLTILSAEGKIVRSGNRGDWTASRHRWMRMEAWLGEPLQPNPDGHTAMVERWLRSFGPGTVADLKWWLGSTISAVKKSLTALDVIEVDLDGAVGYLMADDAEPEPPVEPWTALLPGLDPTIMGWTDRDFYLDPDHRAQLFDTNGNAGPTAWADGRVVGGWWQSEDGAVQLQLLDDIGRDHTAALRTRAEELSVWLGGRRILPRFPSPLAKSVSAR